MATIKATCPLCGDVKLRSRDLTVRVCAETDHGTYTFACPRCREHVNRDATPRILALLVSAGVRTEVWHQPAELFEPRGGPPLSVDDLLDFHLALARDDWFTRLAEGVADTGN
jgi:rRNA maturation protein Nop10